MNSHIHHVPGRLRLRTQRLKRDHRRAGEIEEALRGLPAVTSAEVNPLTGSVTVHYDRAITDLAALTEILQQHAGLDGRLPAPSTSFPQTSRRAPGPGAVPGERMVHTVAKTAARYLLEQALERSVVLLLASLL